MATSDNPPEGGFPVPSTYPNPLANNVNMQPLPWPAPLDGRLAQDAPISIDGAVGSEFKAE